LLPARSRRRSWRVHSRVAPSAGVRLAIDGQQPAGPEHGGGVEDRAELGEAADDDGFSVAGLVGPTERLSTETAAARAPPPPT